MTSVLKAMSRERGHKLQWESHLGSAQKKRYLRQALRPILGSKDAAVQSGVSRIRAICIDDEDVEWATMVLLKLALDARALDPGSTLAQLLNETADQWESGGCSDEEGHGWVEITAMGELHRTWMCTRQGCGRMRTE